MCEKGLSPLTSISDAELPNNDCISGNNKIPVIPLLQPSIYKRSTQSKLLISCLDLTLQRLESIFGPFQNTGVGGGRTSTVDQFNGGGKRMRVGVNNRQQHQQFQRKVIDLVFKTICIVMLNYSNSCSK